MFCKEHKLILPFPKLLVCLLHQLSRAGEKYKQLIDKRKYQLSLIYLCHVANLGFSFSIKKTIYSRSAKEVKKKLQTNAKKGFWSTNADLDFAHADLDLHMQIWICTCRSGSDHAYLDLTLHIWVCTCRSGSAQLVILHSQTLLKSSHFTSVRGCQSNIFPSDCSLQPHFL